MEGIIDPPTDPAFDIADMCAAEEDDDVLDETITPSTKGLGQISEYRDLSAWRIKIPNVATHCDANGKKYFIFVIDVQRIDIQSTKENAEDLQWKVHRKYSEFYTLEARLTEFHGEFDDLQLPPKANIFTGKGLDVLQSNIKPFQDYLDGLLKKPFLRESDILFTFLRSTEEFTMASSTIGVGKIINKVNPMKLTTKERGQSLQPFIDSFVASTLSPPSKPRYDSVIGSDVELDDYTTRLIEPHSLFGNNFDLMKPPQQGQVFAFAEKNKLRQDKGTFDVIFYLLVYLFKAPALYVQFVYGLGILFRRSFDHLVDYVIGSKLATVLCCNRVAYLIKLVENSLFTTEATPNTKWHQQKRKEEALEKFQNYLRPYIQPLCGQGNYEESTQFVFDALQDPILNKQLTYILVDVILDELFPELGRKSYLN